MAAEDAAGARPATSCTKRPGRAPGRKRGPQPKRVPQRTCVGCGTVQPKRQLVRLVAVGGGVELDPTGKAPGRGAYLHSQRTCWQRALQGGALEHALKTSLTEADRARLWANGEQYPNDDA